MTTEETTYSDALNYLAWSKSLLSEVNRQLSSYNGTSLSGELWDLLLSNYMIAIVHSPTSIDQVFFGLLEAISKRTRLSVRSLVSTFSNYKYETPRITHLGVPLPEVVSVNGVTTVSIGNISLKINDAYYRQHHQSPLFRETVIRYSMINDRGFSIPPQLIKELDTGTTIECFASPFNYTCSNFCSMFDSDINLPYPEGVSCRGDFFKMMETLENNTVPITFCVHPPLVNSIINRTVDKILRYSDRVSGCIILMLLPNSDTPVMRRLLDRPDLNNRILEKGKYTLYNPVTGTESQYNSNMRLIASDKLNIDNIFSYSFSGRY